MDKTLLILGASSDVGIDFINQTHNYYSKIIAHYNNLNDGLKLLKKLLGTKLVLVRANFLNDDALLEFVNDIKTYDVTHVLHLSSPKVTNNKFHKTEWTMFQQGFDIQVRSVYMVLNELLPKMSKANYGKVVFLLSSVTNNEPPKYWSDYVTNKYALLGFMKALAQEYAMKKININAVSPSMMETKFLEKIPELIIEQNARASKLGRNAETSDAVSAIQFLLSDESGYITGQNLVVSGGS